MFFLTAVMIHAQEINVQGTVISRVDDEPLIGATVICEVNKKGVATDIEGKFSMSVPKGSVLKVSYVGYQTVEVKADGAQGRSYRSRIGDGYERSIK